MPGDAAWHTAQAIGATLAAIRARAPLIHNITNLVVTNITANALLAVGASPAMVEGAEEVAGFVRVAEALVINLGTLSAPRAASMRLAVAAAAACGTPWVLDPVAVGAIPTRRALAHELMAHRPAAIRGNASEIMALAGAAAGGKGVDSTAGADAAVAAARHLAGDAAGAVAVTGAVDYVAGGGRLVEIHNGHALMPRVTGMGCTATALVGACLAVQADPLVAMVHALALLGVAGELAGAQARGPGSFQVALLDTLHGLDTAALAGRLRLKIHEI